MHAHALARNLEPHDRLLAAIVRQAIADLKHGTCCEREEARQYLASIGLLDDAGDVVQAAVADVTLVWPGTENLC